MKKKYTKAGMSSFSGRLSQCSFTFQVLIPAQGLLFRPMGVYDGFVVDPVFAEPVSLGPCHGSPADRYQD